MNFTNYLKVVLFDLDGTILNTESIYMNLMIEYSKKNNLLLSKKYYINNLLGKTKTQIDGYLQKKFKNEFNSKKYWEELLKYREEYINNNEIEVKKGFYELLEYLKEKNIQIGIVTSNSKSLVNKLIAKTKININDFNFILTREDVENTKPAPEIYNKAVKMFNVDKENVIAIEDSNVGVLSALNAGIKVFNVKDIDILEEELKEKCIKIGKTLNCVYKYIKEMED